MYLYPDAVRCILACVDGDARAKLRLRAVDATWNAVLTADVLEPEMDATRVYMHAMLAAPGSRRALLRVLGRRLTDSTDTVDAFLAAYVHPRRSNACTARTRAGTQCMRPATVCATRLCTQHHNALLRTAHYSGTAATKFRLKEKSAP